MSPRRLRASGFTLTELAIVLVIVALLASGLIMPLSAQLDARRLAEARRQLADIREALLGYALATGRLPPPADPTKKTGIDADAGVMDEGRTAGVLPWVTLGLPEADPWGQRFTYRVTPSFADAITANTLTPPASCSPPAPPTLASFALCSEGNITVTDGTLNIATTVPAIVVSHGKNGLGAYRPDGSKIPGATGTEAENADGDGVFVSRTQGSDFDDELVWIPLHLLLNRMVSAGRLP